jgi:alanyl-tRNA synthetase
MQARELRQKYLEFFESKGALRQPSDSLVADDPTLLFTVAGMVPFKAYFEDRATPPRTSLATSQKCLRTIDIDDIGDTSHCTFFEMLGNFSFGDYFKQEAITWAWEFLTEVLKLDPKDLRVTVFQDDDDAYDIWHKTCGLPTERISRLGEKTNYWPSNAIQEKSQGPCGPCSEIFFDLQPDQPFNADWDGQGTRWLEIWNLVFTQFTGRGEGEAFQLIPLPKKNIDTGMGLERTAAAINRLSGPFETDVLRPIIAKLEELSEKSYTSTPDALTDIAFRRIADHVRATTFLMSDGVTPDRTGRGYVLRRLMRRAIVAGIRRLGFTDEPFLHEAIPTIVGFMKDTYPELVDRQEYIINQVKQEETLFRRTLANGLARLDEELATGELSGRRAYFLYETFGLPFEITREIAAERGVDVDEAGYREAEGEARTRSREAADTDVWKSGGEALKNLLKDLPLTQFVGYSQLETQARIIGIVSEGQPVQTLSAGQEADILLDTTSFYAESGGQVGDTGALRGTLGAFTVTDTRKQNGLYFHKGVLATGQLSVGDDVVAGVDTTRRRDIMRNHTATHLLHKALRDKLGTHVQQRGSLVAPDRLRFDFAHGKALTPEEIKEVEQEVNEAILNELPVIIEEKNIDEARQMGAMMLFGEKYGDVVRVVSIGGEFSREFCGGTHVGNASQIGPFRLVSEGSAAAGVRRVEALTGRGADEFDITNGERLKQIAQLLGVTPAQAPEAVEKLQADLKTARHALSQAQRAQAGNQAEALSATAQRIGELAVVIATPPQGVQDGAALSALADDILARLKSGVVLLGAVSDGKVLFVAKASKDAVAKGAHAGNIVKAAAQTAGGGGGGRPDFAQAGGRDASRLPDALKAAEAALTGQLVG